MQVSPEKSGMHVTSRIPSDYGGSHALQISSKKKGGGFLKMALPINHLVQFLQKKRSSGPISAKKKVNKKKGEEWICGADLFSGTNIDNEIEKKEFPQWSTNFYSQGLLLFLIPIIGNA